MAAQEGARAVELAVFYEEGVRQAGEGRGGNGVDSVEGNWQ